MRGGSATHAASVTEVTGIVWYETRQRWTDSTIHDNIFKRYRVFKG